MDTPYNHSLMALFISMGKAGEKVRKTVQPLFDGVPQRAETLQPSQGIHTPEDQSSPVLWTVDKGIIEIKPHNRYLQDADLVFLCATSEGDDFPNARRAILEAMGKNSFLFTFPFGPGSVRQPISDQECVVRAQGPDPAKDISCFVRDFTAWNMFPHTISCDWADIKNCLGGKEKTLAIYSSQSHNYETRFTEFLGQRRKGLQKSGGILLLAAFRGVESISWDELTRPLDILQYRVGMETMTIYLESCYSEQAYFIGTAILF